MRATARAFSFYLLVGMLLGVVFGLFLFQDAAGPPVEPTPAAALAVPAADPVSPLTEDPDEEVRVLMARDATTLCSVRFDDVSPMLGRQSLVARSAQRTRERADSAAIPQADSESERVVIARSLEGLADSLVGAVTGLYAALLAGARIHLDFGDPELGWEDAMSAPFINWTLEALPAWARDSSLSTEFFFKSPLTFNLLLSGRLYGAMQRVDGITDLFEGRRVLLLSTNAGHSSAALKNPSFARAQTALGLSTAGAFGCAVSFLFRPLPEVYRAAAPEFARVLNARDAGDVIVAIHIRAGASYDASFRGALSAPAMHVLYYAGFWACAEQIGAELLSARGGSAEAPRRIFWVLATDLAELRNEAVAVFGAERIITRVDLRPSHSRHNSGGAHRASALRDSVSEYWLLSLADAFVLSSWSGFGRQASVLRNQVLGERPTFILDATKSSSAQGPSAGSMCASVTSLNYAALAATPGFF